MMIMVMVAVVMVVGSCASPTFTFDPSNPQNVIVEKAIRSYLNKPTGELTKADLKRVTGLDLYRTNISDAGLKGLAKLTQLKGLRVQQTKVTKAGMTQLQKALPECHIVSDADK